METIAIPAFNEGRHIGRLLAQLEHEAPRSVVEILVCDNASTDDTPGIVGGWAERCERVRLVEATVPGKPAAWNRLVEAAAAPVILFLDADVVLSPGSLARLVGAVADGCHVAYAGRRRFRTVRPGLGPRLVAWLADPVLELCLAGPCYAVRKEPILAHMRERGFDRMPDVFAEDIWLHALLEPGELRLVQDCVVDIELDGFERYLALTARKQIVATELDVHHPDLARSLESNHPEAMPSLAQARFVFRGDFAARAKAQWLAAAALKWSVNQVFRRRLTRLKRAYQESYDRHGGSHLLRYVASTSPRLADPRTGELP